MECFSHVEGSLKLMKQMWELKQAAQADTLDMFVYGTVEDMKIDYENYTIVQSENSAKHFKEELVKHPDVKQINVFVNSLGGYVVEAMAIRNQLKRHPANVTGYIDGFAASAASFLLTGCDQVKMYSNCMQLLHNALNGVFGNAKELRKGADDLDAIMVGNRQAYLAKSDGKLTEEKLIEILDNETWLNAEECLAYGLCDEIIAEEKDLTNAKQMLQKMNASIEQQISYNKFVAAQLRQLVEPIPEPELIPEPEPTPDPIPEPAPNPEPTQNKTKNLMAALFANLK